MRFTVTAYRTQKIKIEVEAQDEDWAWDNAIDAPQEDWCVLETSEPQDYTDIRETGECDPLDPNDSDYHHDVLRNQND